MLLTIWTFQVFDINQTEIGYIFWSPTLQFCDGLRSASSPLIRSHVNTYWLGVAVDTTVSARWDPPSVGRPRRYLGKSRPAYVSGDQMTRHRVQCLMCYRITQPRSLASPWSGICRDSLCRRQSSFAQSIRWFAPAPSGSFRVLSGVSIQRNARNATDVTDVTQLTERTQRPMREATAPSTLRRL